MKRACIAMVLAIAVIPWSGARAQETGQPPTGRDVQGRGERSSTTMHESVEWQQGFPIPKNARRNDSLGGATSLAPGKNYMLTVYETDSTVEAMLDFYAHHLPDAKRVSDEREVRFVTSGGYVRLGGIGKMTRITLVVGPR